MAPSAKADKKRKEKGSENKENGQELKICCVPAEKVFCTKPEITVQSSVVKVLCSSGKCPKSGLMHTECFDKWEDLIVGFLAKQGRGRTWSDKQRYANVWANKGYDLVFKTCACDCGHGSLRKDLDYVPAPVPVEGAAGGGGAGPAQAQQDAPDKKKKKKEKTSLKPKLNFSVLNVSGSYFGSIKQKEDELEENKWNKEPTPPAKVVINRLSSEKADSPSPVPFIPGLNPPPFSPSPAQTKPKYDQERIEKASSAPPQPCEDGWVTVPSKLGNNRRNSQQSMKQLKRKNSTETVKTHVLDVDSKNNNLDSKPPSLPLEVHDPELLNRLKKKTTSGFSPPNAGNESFPSLPMYQPPPPTCFESALKYERNDLSDQKVLAQNQIFTEKINPREYTTNIPFHPPDFNPSTIYKPESSLLFPHYNMGARPKFNPSSTFNNASKSTEEIYQSDEDISFEDLDKNLEKLVDGSPCETPKWSSSPPKSPFLNPDKEMNILWEQTKGFEAELNSFKEEANQKVTKEEISSDGKRDKNGFIHCSSCSTVHSSTSDFTMHCNSDQHRNNAVWARKLENAEKADLASGWESFGKVVDSWEERADMSESSFNGSESNRANKKDSSTPVIDQQELGKSPASAFEEVKRRALSRKDSDLQNALNEVKKQVISKKKGKSSRAGTPDLSIEIENLRKELEAEKEAKERAIAENTVLKKEIIAENEARKRTLEELQILRNSKKNIEKQAVIVENTLKVESSEKLKFKKLLENSEAMIKKSDEEMRGLLENSEALIKKRDEEIRGLRAEKEKHEAEVASALLEAKETDCDIKSLINELKETKDLLIQEQQKNEANTKLMKKQKEKSEKLLQREKDSRLLAEKSAELAEKNLATMEQKKVSLENQLKKEEILAKTSNIKMKEEARKRIVAELELVEQQKKFNEISDKFVKQAAVLNDEKNNLAEAVNCLVKDKEILNNEVNNARATASVIEETSETFMKKPEEISKQTSLEGNNGLAKEGPEKNDGTTIDEEGAFEVAEDKNGKMDLERNKNGTVVSLQSDEMKIRIVEDRIVDIEESDDSGETDDELGDGICQDDQAVLEDDAILDQLKDVQKKQMDHLFTETETMDHKMDQKNCVFELFDEVNRRTQEQEVKEGVAEGWEMFEDELNIDGSLITELDFDETSKELINIKETKKGKSNDLKDDVIKDINEFLKDDVLKNCLNSIFKDSEANKSSEESKEKEEVKLFQKEFMLNQLKKLPKGGDPGVDKPESDLVLASDDDSLPGLDRYPKLGLDDEIDPYLGPDQPGEFDDYEVENNGDVENVDMDENQKKPEPLDYDQYDLLGCPCKGEHNPNGSCKSFPAPTKRNPFDMPYYGAYLREQELEGEEQISEQPIREILNAQWAKYMDPNYDPNLDEDLALPTPKSLLPPLLSRLSSTSLPPLPNPSKPVEPTNNTRTRRASSSSVSPPLTSPTDENFSSSTVNSSPLSSSPPESEISKSHNNISTPSDQASSSETSRLSSLEHSVSMLQSMMNTMGTQVTSLTTQLEDSNFQSGLLSRTVEKMQEKNCELQQTVNHLQESNSMLEKKLLGNTLNLSSGVHYNPASDDVGNMKENLLELLSSCESFQKGFDMMIEKQSELENKLKSVTNNFEKSKVENKELREDFAKLNDKFSSLTLENQVDKGQMKAQLDSLGYNMAILTSKIPAESFSSTSGVRSGDISENEEGVDKVEKNDDLSPLPPLELKEIVSAVVFSRDEPVSTEADSSTSTSKTSSTTTLATSSSTTSVSKMKKFIYNSSTMNQQGFPHPSPSGGPVWMSPDGSMVAVPPAGTGVPTVPPTSTHPTLPLPTGARSLYGPVAARGSINQIGMAQTYMNQPGGMVYPFNYSVLPNMFYHR